MREAVIVSTARTPLTKAHRGEFNATPGPELGAFAVRAALLSLGITEEGIELKKPEQTLADGSDAEARRVEVTLAP